MSDDTCRSCLFWNEMPRPAGAGGAVDVTAPVTGQCRGGPPSLTTLPTAQGQLSLVGYPPVPADFPACARHARRAAAEAPARADGARWWDRTLAELAAAGHEGNGFAADCLRADLALRWRAATDRECQDVLTMLAAVWRQLARVPAAAPAGPAATH